MRRLLRRTGVLLASLSVAISGLVVAPVGTAPAQATHISYDWAHWQFIKYGSWWFAESDNNFTTYWECLRHVSIYNDGSQQHFFQWEWTTYAGPTVQCAQSWIGAHHGKAWDARSGGWGARHQIDQPRVKIYWENSAGQMVLLWDLHGWSSTAYDIHTRNWSVNSCDE